MTSIGQSGVFVHSGNRAAATNRAIRATPIDSGNRAPCSIGQSGTDSDSGMRSIRAMACNLAIGFSNLNRAPCSRFSEYFCHIQINRLHDFQDSQLQELRSSGFEADSSWQCRSTRICRSSRLGQPVDFYMNHVFPNQSTHIPRLTRIWYQVPGTRIWYRFLTRFTHYQYAGQVDPHKVQDCKILEPQNTRRTWDDDAAPVQGCGVIRDLKSLKHIFMGPYRGSLDSLQNKCIRYTSNGRPNETPFRLQNLL